MDPFLKDTAVPLSFSDIKQIAAIQGHSVTKNAHTFNFEPVFRINQEAGLYTLNELKQRFLH